MTARAALASRANGERAAACGKVDTRVVPGGNNALIVAGFFRPRELHIAVRSPHAANIATPPSIAPRPRPQAKAIRGFCHLYDGQEATASGVHAALTQEDCWITSYRCHYVR